MRLRLATVFLCLLVGSLFALFVPLDRLFDVFQMAISALAIMVAAILVRLNRTMPNLDWKTLEGQSSEDLTGAVVDLAREYLGFLAVASILILGIFALTILGKPFFFNIDVNFPVASRRYMELVRPTISGMIGLWVALICIRMSYLVWRDFDIVLLQKRIVDEAAKQAYRTQQGKLASDKRLAMNQASLRAEPLNKPKDFDSEL